jgi:hypothetical protein
MFRSPSISKLMLWYSENKSNQEGGDNLVRHPCNSKAWRHFHDNVDTSFGDDPRNVYFALAADVCESIQADTIYLVHMASDFVELQLAALAVH